MLLPALVGHVQAQERLARAYGSGRLPLVLLFIGPQGIGKQRLALWLAQMVLCVGDGVSPCGVCRACRSVNSLSHPDLHWFVPIPRPKAGEPEKQVEEVAEALGQVMADRRNNPLYGAADGLAGHFVATARLIQHHASLTPVEGARKMFIVGEAERLVPQESSPEAANALLKLLEEPPADASFVLTATDPARLLPTIRSRAVPIRLGRAADSEVREFLRRHMDPPLTPEALEERVTRAQGVIGAALHEGLAEGQARQRAGSFLDAVLAGQGAILERALKQPPWQARGDFTALLDEVAGALSQAARASLGESVQRPLAPELTRRGAPERLMRAMERVAAAREAAQGNVNPQLLLAVLGDELAAVL